MASGEESVDGDLTEGSLVRPMFMLAWPLVVIQLLQVAYNVGDTFWLGALSPEAVGAVSLAFPLLFLLIAVGSGFTTAGAILVAQHTGAESGKSGLIAGQTLSFISIVAVILGIVGYVATDPMLAALPADPDTQATIIPLAGDYLRVFFLGLPFVFGFYVFVALMRGYGSTRMPMRVMVVSVVINLAIDPLLIFGVGPLPRLEVAGAAVATVISRGVATGIGFYLLYYTDVGPTIEPDHLRPRLEFVSEITRLGVPTAIEQSMTALALVAMTAIVVTFPPAVVAAYGLGNRLISLVFLPALGMGQSMDAIVGQNLGAGKSERAATATWIGAGVIGAIMAVAGAVAFLFPEPFVAVFLTAEAAGRAETINYGTTYLQFAAVAFVFMGVMQVVLGAFRGAGNTKTALAFSVLGLWIVRVPVTYYLIFVADWGTTGIWTGVVVGDIIGAVAAVAWFTRGTWTEAIVDDESDEHADSSESEVVAE
ncbi:MATE family efflux transporter [Natrarchaeobaculum sulfurireducens]|uniref:Multi antimicrobial extrusion protein (Na(+)/drug antiporter), MATE family of MDR efflux pumps n=1 Tax=Natrarchaeobaculum sulfurireducens TaxID=2044521 RepID=A0A346PMY7_9EURY|nr:MATE family efflux transporter [Natrarchaeobaculum sulfurireducens]AXR79084.1 Na+-driven multidrug efflux pump [Natrarchaeobaculum sulfurireducens]AXR80882.1 Multi antimicrobial extrusion protein (Na(+)/drug antiporter), MATE family of MDR efflux pumps [Natrarchaeobaculum sulfurireducens]